MPEGKPAGVRCVQLDANNLCTLFGSPLRPMVCGQFDYDPTVPCVASTAMRRSPRCRG